MKKKIASLALGAAFALAIAPSATAATLSDNFDTGYTTGAPLNGQTGGTGWSTPWATSAANAAYTVVGAGNQTVDANVTVNGTVAAGRTYDNEPTQTAPSGGLTFSLRVDSINGFVAGNASGDDYIGIFDRPGLISQNEFGADGTWLVRGGYAGNTANTLQWRFYNGTKNGAGFTQAAFVDSGVVITAGTIYDFQVNFLGNGNWSASVNGVQSGTLGFRSAATDVSRNLYFNLRNESGAPTGPNDINYDILNVAAIPEPTAALLGLGSLGALALLRRRN